MNEHLLEIHRFANGEHLKRKAIHVVILTAIWCIWRSRNERICKGRRVSISSLKEEIKSLSFLWVKNRARLRDLSWEDWCNFQLLWYPKILSNEKSWVQILLAAKKGSEGGLSVFSVGFPPGVVVVAHGRFR
ncbi:hypothetical protein R6Q59_033058 [Mikania micrantha]